MTAQERPAGRPTFGARPAGARPDDDAPTATEQLVDQLVPIAAQLVGCVRDYGPDDVHAVLAKVPDGRFDALAVVLAAMADPDLSPAELLAWVDAPARSRDMPQPSAPERLADMHRPFDVIAVERAMAGDRVHLHPTERAEAIHRLAAAGLTFAETAIRLGISRRTVERHRAAQTRRTA